MCAEGASNEELEAASSGLVGENDLLIVGPGVLGRLVAEKWREVLITTIPLDLVKSVIYISLKRVLESFFVMGILLRGICWKSIWELFVMHLEV